MIYLSLSWPINATRNTARCSHTPGSRAGKRSGLSPLCASWCTDRRESSWEKAYREPRCSEGIEGRWPRQTQLPFLQFYSNTFISRYEIHKRFYLNFNYICSKPYISKLNEFQLNLSIRNFPYSNKFYPFVHSSTKFRYNVFISQNCDREDGVVRQLPIKVGIY